MAKRVTRRRFLAATAVTATAAASGVLTHWLDDEEKRGPQPLSARTPLPTPLPTPVRHVDEEADGYVAVAPRILRSGQVENISLSLFQGDRLVGSTGRAALLKDGKTVAEASAWVPGKGVIPLQLPALAVGDYQLHLAAKGVEDTATLRVEDGTLVFLETDKPIYKPGQVIHIRVLALDPALRPVSGEAVVEVMDAQGIKVFKKPVVIDDFGMALIDLPLSTEPNLGVWKVQATAGERSTQVDVRVERYVLPKYEVRLDLPKEWVLADEGITGSVFAEYSFGRPVNGEVEIVASRYVGVWEEYARFTASIDGTAAFDLPPVRYVAGSPDGGGLGSVRVDIAVREQATGYEETTSELIRIASSPVVLRLIPETTAFKPGLSLTLLVVAETPDQQPVDADVELRLRWQDEQFNEAAAERVDIAVRAGVGSMQVTPPADAVSLTIEASGPDASYATLTLRAGYSPSGSFIQVEQVSRGPLKVGDTVEFRVSATREARLFFYEVLARGTVAFSGFSQTPEITVDLTPLMAPAARLLVYQILPNSEVAADYLPFSVAGEYPLAVGVETSVAEAMPGDDLDVRVQTDGPARVGLAAVDRSVFVLAENRLNLQQVFEELERLFMAPQAELHEVEPIGGMPVPAPAPVDIVPWGEPFAPQSIPGAHELFEEAGVVILTNRRVPEGKELEHPHVFAEAAAGVVALPLTEATAATGAGPAAQADGLAEVQRVRQFFPETWIWADVTTGENGRATVTATAPDSITTWMLRAVALSKERGLGIAETEVRVFQPFFVQVDLPYSAIRGEELPVSIALYNYQSTAQQFSVELDPADWFDTLDNPVILVDVGPSEVGSASFRIRPHTLGTRSLKVTARSRETADAIIRELIVEPEGVQREAVDNRVLSPDTVQTVDLTVPSQSVPGSARAYIALTGNVLTQTIDGLEGLLQMPFGCGEQNMILFAPNVFVTRYLEETGQIKPEVLAKAEKLMLTGYQRELTFRRSDGSFSAFGEQDAEGSLWLTAFVLKTFAQAGDLIYVDEAVQSASRDWIRAHQNPDGSFDPVGFVHHQELLGGLSGRTALTAFVAIALREAGDDSGGANAVRYLEGQLASTDDPYAVAIVAYALVLAGSGQAQAAIDKLMALAKESDEGLYWGEDRSIEPLGSAPFVPPDQRSTAIETTGYAALALLEHGDSLTAGRAIRWLAAQRNAFGGFGSTQDTVVALQAMTAAAAESRADTDATVSLSAGEWRNQVAVTPENADVLQVIEVPAGESLTIETRGRGQVMGQIVRRYNLPAVDEGQSIFHLDVQYSADEVEVDDLIDVTATIRFTPPEPVAAGMIVLDIAVPTGFSPVEASIDAMVASQPKLKRWDLAGRKVIFYIEDMLPGDELTLTFEARALHPVRAESTASRVYAYYRPSWRGEALSGRLAVV